MKLHSKTVLMSIMLCFVTLSPAVASERKPINLSTGVGVGIPFGILGFNAEVTAFNLLGLSACFGTTIVAGSASCIGATVYLPISDVFSARLSIFEGTYGVLGVETNFLGDTEWEDYKGQSIGIGFIAGATQHNAVFDLLYILDDKLFDDVDRLEESGYDVEMPSLIGLDRIKISIGYRYTFF